MNKGTATLCRLEDARALVVPPHSRVHILIGVASPPPSVSPSIELLRRVAFPGSEYEYVHAIAPPIPVGWPAEVLVAAETLLWHREDEGARMLGAMETLALGNADLAPSRCTLVDGSAADALIHHSDSTGAELIAVDATEKGSMERFLAGSTSQSVVNGAKGSVLVARPARHPGPLKVVFATDHSPFADRCAHVLARMAPRGIASLTVATAWPETRFATIDALAGSGAIRPGEAYREALVRRNHALERVLDSVALHTHSVLIPDDPNPAIHQIVEETGADLLILGARGHGFLERLALGSVSLHQVQHSRASVLVLR